MAVESSADAYMTAQPTEAMTFQDWRAQSKYHGFVDPDSFVGRIANFFDGSGDKQRRDYQTYLDNLDRLNTYNAEQSARGYETWKDSTNYQRTMKDLEAAGLNPYLLINNGGLSASSSTTSARADYGRSTAINQRQKNSDAGRNIALLLLAVAKVAAALM